MKKGAFRLSDDALREVFEEYNMYFKDDNNSEVAEAMIDLVRDLDIVLVSELRKMILKRRREARNE